MNFTERFVFGDSQNNTIMLADLTTEFEPMQYNKIIKELKEYEETSGLTYKMFYNEAGNSDMFVFKLDDDFKRGIFGDCQLIVSSGYMCILVRKPYDNVRHRLFESFTSSYVTIHWKDNVLTIGRKIKYDFNTLDNQYHSYSNVETISISNREIDYDDDDYYDGDDDDY